MNLRKIILLFSCIGLLDGQETAAVSSKMLDRKVRLPGEFLPYQVVELHARVTGFVEKVGVDRGSIVKHGQLLVELSAPEMTAQLAEARAKVQTLEAQKAEADAKLVANQSTYERLKAASATPGAIAGNELILAEKGVEASRAVIKALESSIRASQASVDALADLQAYLKVTAPFDGIITERYVHPGALVGPGAGSSAGPLLRLEQVSRLRLVVSVPESEVSGIVRGARVSFTVSDHPGAAFSGVVARIPRSLDPKTRTMPVELDIDNARGTLAPGMYPEVSWPVRKARSSLLVPATAVVTTTERVFVVRVRDGKAEWVNVTKGPPSGELVEVAGDLKPGDLVVKRASDEIREGTAIKK